MIKTIKTIILNILVFNIFLSASSINVNSMVNKLSLEQKIGQMFMLRYTGDFYRNDDPRFIEIKKMIIKHYIGGIVTYVGSAHGTIFNLNELQSFSEIPLLVAADFERGVGQKVSGATLFPSSMAMSATNDPKLSYEHGRITAIEARALGVHITFAPVVDVNSNPKNPIINFRSYGDTPEIVTKYSSEFIKGCQDNGIIACIKHFPGHGDTETDSHTTLPIINKSEKKFREIDLLPFKKSLDANVKMIMTGHIAVPSMDSTKTPATLSYELSGKIIRDEFKYDGLIVTDAMEMGGITESYWSAEAAIKTIEAGSDIILLPIDNLSAIKGVIESVRNGRISEERINKSVKRILKSKFDLDLWNNKKIDFKDSREILGKFSHKRIASESAKKSITLVNDKNKLIPIDISKNKHIGHLLLATNEGMLKFSNNYRSKISRLHGNVKSDFYSKNLSNSEINKIISDYENSDLIIISLLIRVAQDLGTYTIDPSHRKLIEKLQKTNKPIIVTSFGSPYLKDVDSIETYLLAYYYGSISMNAMVNALFGSEEINGKLPVTLSKNLPQGKGLSRYKKNTLLEDYNSYDFSSAKRIINDAINNSIFPGASVVVLKDGKKVLNFQSGFQTYEKKNKIHSQSIYDLASLTKVIATTPVAMKLFAQKKLPLDEPIKDFITLFSGENKNKVTIRHLLTHSSGLMPFDTFPIDYSKDKILLEIINKPLINKPGSEYVYSDFGPILLKNIYEIVSNKKFEQLCSDYIFKPLKMKNTFFNPDERYFKDIVPTEIDTVYKRGLLKGVVHDERAWQLGGVAGHAGLFSTSDDLARFCLMMINGGHLEGKRYFNADIITEFVAKQNLPENSNRALGWDTPSKKGSLSGNFFSDGSYGHTGFTGTSIWIDPNEKIGIIVLTNRVHPSRNKPGMRDFRINFHDDVMQTLKKLN